MEFSFDLQHNLRFKNNIGKYVKVKTVDSCEHEGWLECIDPTTGNLILAKFDENLSKICSTVLIMNKACYSLEVLKETNKEVQTLLENPIDNNYEEPYEDIPDKKKRLIAWIKENRLPVFDNEDQSLIVAGNVTILPPYDAQSCSSMSEITLKSIQELVAKLPSNIK